MSLEIEFHGASEASGEKRCTRDPEASGILKTSEEMVAFVLYSWANSQGA